MIRIISIVVATLLFCYIVFVSFFFREIRQDSICQDLQVVVKDSLDKHFVSESDLVSILKKAGLDPIKRSMACLLYTSSQSMQPGQRVSKGQTVLLTLK